jgi:hypothetical protein
MHTPAIVFAAALALAAPPAVPAAPAASSASCDGSSGPLFGVARVDGKRVLARIGRRTLRPLPAPRIPLPSGIYGWSRAFSPTCDAVALAGRPGRILLVDLERGRRIGTASVGTRSAVAQVAWPRPDRLIALVGPYRAPRMVTFSVPDLRIVSSRRLAGQTGSSEATSLGLVALAAPRDRIGSATLALARPDGGLLQVPLPRIRAGLDFGDPRRLLGRQLTPGLAVDEAGGRAYVVAANEPLVAEVDLASGAVSYHALRGRGGTTGSPMAAKGLEYGAYRTARWVGAGTIAVAGEVTRTRRDWRRAARRGQPVTRIDPHGLRLIRIADWSMTTLNPLLRWFAWAGDALLGMNSVSVSLGDSTATGLVAYGTDGTRRFTRFRDIGRGWLRGAAWPYAYVTARGPKRTYVVDVRTGRTVNVVGSMRPPVLLVR